MALFLSSFPSSHYPSSSRPAFLTVVLSLPLCRCFRLCLPCRPRAKGTRTNTIENRRDPSVLDVPLLEYAFEHSDKAALAATFVEVFRGMHAEGCVAKDMVLAIL